MPRSLSVSECSTKTRFCRNTETEAKPKLENRNGRNRNRNKTELSIQYFTSTLHKILHFIQCMKKWESTLSFTNDFHCRKTSESRFHRKSLTKSNNFKNFARKNSKKFGKCFGPPKRHFHRNTETPPKRPKRRFYRNLKPKPKFRSNTSSQGFRV